MKQFNLLILTKFLKIRQRNNMNEQAYQDQMDDDAQFDAEQEELREIACAKYEDYRPLINEMIKHSLDIGQIDMYELLIDSKDKLEKFISESEWQDAIDFMDKLLEV